MEGPVIAEGLQVKLEGFGFDQPVLGSVVEHDVREIRLPGHGAKGGELRCGEPRKIKAVGVRIGDPLQDGGGWIRRRGQDPAELREIRRVLGHDGELS